LIKNLDPGTATVYFHQPRFRVSASGVHSIMMKCLFAKTLFTEANW
jgi:hypothetical protein